MNTISNDNRTKKEVIDTFLGDVEKKLPFWLRGEKEELKEILEELETHIWDGASELAEGNDPSIEQIEQVIEQLGSPSKIAEEYKHRGKPKFYITEELFPIYTKVLFLVAGVIFAFNLLGMLLSIGSHSVGGLFGNLFGGFFTSLAIAVILLTIQFVYLSREGYLPENFQRLTSRLPFSLKKYFASKKKDTDVKKRYDEEPAKTTTESYAATEEAIKDDEPKIRIISEGTFAEPQVIKETIIVKEPRRTRDRDEPRPERVVKYSYRNTLSEGITGMIFGTVFVILPFLPVLNFIGYYLSIWISVFGGVMIIGGMIKFLRGIVGRIVPLQQGLMFLGMIPTAASIPLFLTILGKGVYKGSGIYDDLMSLLDLIISKMNLVMDYGIAHTAVTITVYVVVGLTALTLLSELSKIIRLGVEGFPVKSVRHYR